MSEEVNGVGNFVISVLLPQTAAKQYEFASISIIINSISNGLAENKLAERIF